MSRALDLIISVVWRFFLALCESRDLRFRECGSSCGSGLLGSWVPAFCISCVRQHPGRLGPTCFYLLLVSCFVEGYSTARKKREKSIRRILPLFRSVRAAPLLCSSLLSPSLRARQDSAAGRGASGRVYAYLCCHCDSSFIVTCSPCSLEIF